MAHERAWEVYHTPRNLAALISSEAVELLSLLRWDQDALDDQRDGVEAEFAHVLLGLHRFADVAWVDLHRAALRKPERNAAKYPVGPNGPDPAPPTHDDVVCGIDAGTFSSSSYSAWLQFRLGRYRPSPAYPLPDVPEGWQAPTVIALDLP